MKSKVFLTVLIVVLGALIFGCATNKDLENGIAETTVTAMGISEGIQINFEVIPEETSQLFIMLQDATENYEIMSSVSIGNNDLDTLRNTGILVCPFTEKGHVYRISVFYYSQNNTSADDCVNVAAIAKGGNYPDVLSFDGTHYYENIAWTLGSPRDNAELLAYFKD